MTAIGLFFLKKRRKGLELVDHICDSSYSGGRVQEDRGSKPALGK
jgi:hypothetical protein